MNVFITGASSGIGRAIAHRFLEEGHAVFGFDVLESTIENASYHHALHNVADDVPHSLATADGTPLPQPDILINNAGTQSDVDAISVNLLGTIRFTEAFMDAPSLKSLLFIASASARNGSEFPYYVASKAGIVGYMKNRAQYLAARGITVNSISPGGVVTPINQHILEDSKLYKAVKQETLLGKWAKPQEIADLAYFLTVENRSITGEDILVDNGEILKANFIW